MILINIAEANDNGKNMFKMINKCVAPGWAGYCSKNKTKEENVNENSNSTLMFRFQNRCPEKKNMDQ